MERPSRPVTIHGILLVRNSIGYGKDETDGGGGGDPGLNGGAHIIVLRSNATKKPRRAVPAHARSRHNSCFRPSSGGWRRTGTATTTTASAYVRESVANIHRWRPAPSRCVACRRRPRARIVYVGSWRVVRADRLIWCVVYVYIGQCMCVIMHGRSSSSCPGRFFVVLRSVVAPSIN